MNDVPPELEKFTYEQTPLWMIEDKITAARKHAQNGNREKTRKALEDALDAI